MKERKNLLAKACRLHGDKNGNPFFTKIMIFRNAEKHYPQISAISKSFKFVFLFVGAYMIAAQ